MPTSQVIYLGELRTSAKHLRSGNEIITDAPVDNQGKGEAFSPTDLVATAFGSCMLTIIGLAAETHNFDITGTKLEITKVMAENPRRISEVIIEFTLPHKNYTVKEKHIIENSARTCPVSQSLHPDIKQTINFNF
jgi:putative redox protein